MNALHPHIAEAELELLLEGIFKTYHYDFRCYARSSLRRRVGQALAVLGFHTVPELLEAVLQQPPLFARLLPRLTVQLSELFRDPPYWRALRQQVVPHLSTYPSLRVWIAGCATGEEAYSMAILLQEEGLLERTQLYATDIDAPSLRTAEAGVYELSRVRGFSKNYFEAGGRASLSDYYSTAYSRVAFSPALRGKILFADHSLATDSAFAEFQLISCRNTLIYFDQPLQDRAITLFQKALCPRGFLGLGSHESLLKARESDRFEPFCRAERIYRQTSTRCT